MQGQAEAALISRAQSQCGGLGGGSAVPPQPKPSVLGQKGAEPGTLGSISMPGPQDPILVHWCGKGQYRAPKDQS